jgi:hypothetical protein
MSLAVHPMLWTISLFDPTPETSLDALTQQWISGQQDYEAYLLTRGQRLIGLYQVEIEQKPGTSNPGAALSGTFAEVCLAEGSTATEAALREVQVTQPPAIQAQLEQWRGHIAPESSRRLWLQPLGLSPLAFKPLTLKDRLLHLTLRYLPSGKTIQELVEFDERIIARYAEYMTQAHWYHIGTYHLFGLAEYMYVDVLDVIEAADRAEALSNDAAVPVTTEMQTIYDECDLFVDKKRERYQLWLRPLVLGQAAQASIKLG